MAVDDGGLDVSAAKRELRARFTALQEEHRTLDLTIAGLQAENGDTLQIARLKKRKLLLKDQMIWIEDQLTPDIIA